MRKKASLISKYSYYSSFWVQNLDIFWNHTSPNFLKGCRMTQQATLQKAIFSSFLLAFGNSGEFQNCNSTFPFRRKKMVANIISQNKEKVSEQFLQFPVADYSCEDQKTQKPLLLKIHEQKIVFQLPEESKRNREQQITFFRNLETLAGACSYLDHDFGYDPIQKKINERKIKNVVCIQKISNKKEKNYTLFEKATEKCHF